MSSAIDIYRNKKRYLENDLRSAEARQNYAMQFELKKQIEECEQEIVRLQAQEQDVSAVPEKTLLPQDSNPILLHAPTPNLGDPSKNQLAECFRSELSILIEKRHQAEMALAISSDFSAKFSLQQLIKSLNAEIATLQEKISKLYS